MQISKLKNSFSNEQIDYLIEIFKKNLNIIDNNKIINYLNIIHDVLAINLLNNKTDKNIFDSKLTEINKLIIKKSSKAKIEFDNKQTKHFNDTAGCDFIIQSLNM